MNRSVFALATCSLLLASAVAFAQQQPGQGRGRGGPGGGPGFGFGGFGLGGPGQTQGPLDLVMREAVQKDLAISEDQIGKLREIGGEIREEMRTLFQPQGNPADFANLSEEERRKRREETQTRMAEGRKKLDEKFKPMISEVLTAEQEARLEQIVLQVAGVSALLQPELAKKLGLSKEQQDKLAAINKEYTDKRQELMPQGFGRGGPGGGQPGQGGAGNFQETFAKLRELGETRDKDMLAVLTADQKAKYEEAKGKAFDVASLRGGFGGPGGPGGGRPGAAPGQPGGAGGRPRPPQQNQNQ